MTELDQVWSQMLDEAAANANRDGRRHVAEYLRLKTTNDAIRTAGVGWLFDTIVEIATTANHKNLSIERKSPHNFACGSSNMVGALLALRQGVRCLTLEAGWARIPSDGVMKKGALALARITHFGMPTKTSELRLVHAQTFPTWLHGEQTVIDSIELRRHFELFLSIST